ncbi:MAG: 2-oxo-4-hydroxy-4-carboxy-5-ureidoimidazoline decarboxylase [Rhodospirillales bacterium]
MKEDFVAALGTVYEHAPWVADAAFASRPFTGIAGLHAAMADAIRGAAANRRLALVKGHPALAGKAARAGALTAESAAEQSSAGLDRLSEAEYARFHTLNDAYEARFGFPFIVCARRHGKESILREFERRLGNSPDAELRAALEEILRIGALRLDERVHAPDRLKVHGRLSTHVLDAHGGRPAAGVAIELVELADGGARTVARAATNADGRTDQPLIQGRPVPIARYELRFAIGAYFAGQGTKQADPPFLDVVPVRFAVAEPESHYHVPLLATPWSYTTYRGS